MKTISIINQKGGVGKTTTAMHLGCILNMEKKHRVLLIDVDSQISLTSSLGIKVEDMRKKNIFNVLANDEFIAKNIVSTEYVDIVPSTIRLDQAEKFLDSEIGGDEILRQKIEDLERLDKYDIVMIDCPPAIKTMSVSAMKSSDYIIIPAENEVMSLQGTSQLLKQVNIMQTRLKHHVQVLGILPTKFDPTPKHHREVLEYLRTQFKTLVFSHYIRKNIRLSDANMNNLPINVFDKKANGYKDYSLVADEVISRIEQIEQNKEA
jgi:chromosome partitioning protein